MFYVSYSLILSLFRLRLYYVKPTANNNELGFFQVRVTLSPVTGCRPNYTIFSENIGVTDVKQNSRLFAVTSTTCSTLFQN